MNENEFDIDYEAAPWWAQRIAGQFAPDPVVESIRILGSNVVAARVTTDWWATDQTRWIRMDRGSGHVSVGTEEPES